MAVVATTQVERATISPAGAPVVAEGTIRCEVAAGLRMPQVERLSRRSRHLSMSRRRILRWHRISNNNKCKVKKHLSKRYR